MSYSTDPVLDADRYLTARDAEAAAFDKLAAYIRSEIVNTLTKHVRTVPYATLALPRGGHTNVVRTLADVVSDECSYGKPLDALMAVIAQSDCPHVEALRLAIANSYADTHAEWIAEDRS